jgi:hypothetical protein
MEETKGSVWQGGSWQSSARSTRHFSNPLIQRLHGDGGNTTMALVFGKRGQMCSESMGVTLVVEARMSKRPGFEESTKSRRIRYLGPSWMLTRGQQEPHHVASAQPAEPTCNFISTSRSSPLQERQW